MAATNLFLVLQRRIAPPKSPAEPTASLRRTHHISTRTVAGRPVVRLEPRSGANGRHVLYVPGGAFVMPISQGQWWILRAATRGTGTTITIPHYEVAPTGDPEAAYALIQEVYDDLVTEAGADRITLAGDSAGGALILGQAMALRDAALPQPAQVLLFSPWLDLSLSHPESPALEAMDPVLTIEGLREAATLWAHGRDLCDPRISPAYGEVTGLPPVHVFHGGREIFHPDARDLNRRLHEAGNAGSATYEPTGFHDYVAFGATRAARRSMKTVRKLLR